jgi:hypothetical protein
MYYYLLHLSHSPLLCMHSTSSVSEVYTKTCIDSCNIEIHHLTLYIPSCRERSNMGSNVELSEPPLLRTDTWQPGTTQGTYSFGKLCIPFLMLSPSYTCIMCPILWSNSPSSYTCNMCFIGIWKD